MRSGLALALVVFVGCDAPRTHANGDGTTGGDAGPVTDSDGGGTQDGGRGSDCGGACPDGGTGSGGRISFGAAQTYAEGPGGYFATAADLNGDGALDLVESSVYNGGSKTEIHVLRGSGTGAFTDVTTIAVAAPNQTVVSDFSGDGIPDIAGIGVDGHGPLPDFYLQGQGNFQFAASTWDAGSHGFNINNSLVGGDFDEDGTLDLVGAYFDETTQTDGFVILKMPGFTVVQDSYESEPYHGTREVAAGDFDGDGHQDVITADAFENVVRFYRGNGSGTVTLSAEIALSGSNIQRLSAFDLDRDGRSDVVALHADGTMTISYGTAYGLAPAQIVPLPSVYANWITAGDFDNDGRLDIAVANTGPSQTVDVWRNTPGGFTHAVTLDVAAGITWSLTSGDFNGDGLADLAVPGGNVVTIYLAAP